MNTRKHRREGQSEESAKQCIRAASERREVRKIKREMNNERSRFMNPAWK